MYVFFRLSYLYIISLGLVVWYLNLDRLHSQLLPVNKEQLLVDVHDQQPSFFAMSKTPPSPKELSLHSSQSTPANTPSTDTTRTTAATSDSSKTSTTTSSVTSKATTSATAQYVTVQNIKNLYDSHMIVSQGIKLKWIRNRMMA